VYKQALALAPQEHAHSILSNLGNLYRQQKKFTEAHEVFKQALDFCPDYAPACNNLGLLLVAEGKWDEAIATFDRALLSDPYLDAAKSNRMKAVALSQMRRGDAPDPTPLTSAAADGPTVPAAPSAMTPPVSAAAVSSTPATIESTQREPFPLPSIS
jgi:tetratricopeptide (TPR) repeat protein